jgi:hypothetical protein
VVDRAKLLEGDDCHYQHHDQHDPEAAQNPLTDGPLFHAHAPYFLALFRPGFADAGESRDRWVGKLCGSSDLSDGLRGEFYIDREIVSHLAILYARRNARLPPYFCNVMFRYHLQHLFLAAPFTIPSMPERRELEMKKIAVALVMVGSLSMAGQASAHGHGGDVVGALIGGAVLGAVVSSALTPAPVVAYQPVYAQPAYQPAPVYAGPPPGYCYDPYQRGYVACGAPPQQQYGYGQPQPQPGW